MLVLKLVLIMSQLSSSVASMVATPLSKSVQIKEVLE